MPCCKDYTKCLAHIMAHTRPEDPLMAPAQGKAIRHQILPQSLRPAYRQLTAA